MDSSGPLLCILFVLLFLGGGYFAAAEIAFASVNKIRLRTRADDGDQRARKAMYVLANFDKALTTLLIGNNIMHLSTASLATVIATQPVGSLQRDLYYLCGDASGLLFCGDDPEKLC